MSAPGPIPISPNIGITLGIDSIAATEGIMGRIRELGMQHLCMGTCSVEYQWSTRSAPTCMLYVMTHKVDFDDDKQIVLLSELRFRTVTPSTFYDIVREIEVQNFDLHEKLLGFRRVVVNPFSPISASDQLDHALKDWRNPNSECKAQLYYNMPVLDRRDLIYEVSP
jgi:hypothetical protein